MKKILIIRFSSIGDIVLTTPIVRCVKTQLCAEVHYLTKQPYLPLLEANPYLDKIFTIKKEINEVIADLLAEEYDCIIDLHKNLRSYRVKATLGVKAYSFKKLNFEKWMLVNLGINRLPKSHIVDRYFGAVQDIGVVNDNSRLDYFFPKGFDEKWASKNYGLPLKFIAFAIGAAHQTKRLPTQKIVEICQNAPLPIVLLGGRSEAEEGDEIKNLAGGKVSNFCGKLTLHDSAKMLQLAHKVITHDTGMMHIASAFGKEILSIWGNTVPQFGMSPYLTQESKIFQVEGLGCRPCSKIGFSKCPKGHFRCMADQNVEAICKALT